MNFEQALKAFIAGRIGRNPPLIDEEQFVGDALRFTYGEKSLGATEVSAEAQSIFQRPDLKEEGFEFINTGCHGFVIGNGKTVVKIGEGFEEYGSISPDKIPHGLAAEIMPQGQGRCNGVPYLICERLNIAQPCLLEEMISHFFRSRELGVVYGDAKLENYGHDAQGRLKVLDLGHFEPLDGWNNFARVIRGLLIIYIKPQQYPFVFSDSQNTYVVTDKFSKEFGADPSLAHDPKWRKQMNSILDAVGVDLTKIEYVEGTPVIRIPRTHITYGQPPQDEPLAEYISKALHVTLSHVRPQIGETKGLS